ncbi:MAG: bifunctional UDP-N-acetylglucosamine diphosphorylase/glucosamine-1-phosphate N-acetyltransferase GlmU [Chloroflexota bacterium]
MLAAGKGTRMQSRRHKVLHALAGKPMIWHVLVALRNAGIPPARTTVVVGDGAAEVQAAIEAHFGAGTYGFALQERQLGTGHATLQARPMVPAGSDAVIVAYGDTPLLRAETVAQLLAHHRASAAPLTLVTGHLEDPHGYGRIVRGAARGDGAGGSLPDVQEVVEERDTTPEQRQIREVNSGFCAVDTAWLWSRLPGVQPAPNGEVYLTSLASVAVAEGAGVATLVLDEVVETTGVNSRAQLAEAEAILRGRINRRLLDAGVTLQDQTSTYVDAGIDVGPDTVILANTHLQGQTAIGAECEIGPNAIVRDSTVGARCRVIASVLDGATIEADVTVGPFAHLRPGTRCGRAAAVGTGSEINRSYLGPGSKMMHFGYLGDAMVGENVNVGAGAITCNFDGERKHATTIGDSAFIGSGTLLVAPVAVGAGALTGAGAVVLLDVARDAKVAGVPARPIGHRSAPGQTTEERPATTGPEH